MITRRKKLKDPMLNSKKLFFLILISTGFILIGCAGVKSDQASVVQIPSEGWWRSALSVRQKQLGSDNKSLIQADSNIQKNFALVRQKMIATSATPFTIGFSESVDINAFASLQNGQQLIIFTDGFVRVFGNDPDVVATVLGHELGHHQLGHTQPDYGKDRNTLINVASQSLGMLSSYFIPFSGFLVGNAVKGAGLSYSRDDERDADQFGMKLALAAGFSPCGSYRFSSKMNQLGQSSSLSFLSTHPGSDERQKNSEEFSRLQKNESCEKVGK
jgi:predicted Zn-dependent protease